MRPFIYCLFICVLILNLPFTAAGQQPPQTAQTSTPAPKPRQDTSGQDMSGMNMSQTEPDWMPSVHINAGTSWQPASTSPPMWMKTIDAWDLMAHGVVFVDYNQQGGPRGEGKAESVNWLMLMERHRLGRGSLLFREMFSADSLTAPHPGFPELFQTGETYHGQPLVDHQHP